MGVFGAFFGCIGVVGFNGCYSGARGGDGGFMLACISGCGGVIGCIVATSQLPVREKVRPAWSDGGCEREKVRPAYEKWRKSVVCSVLGEVFRGNAGGRAVLGEFFRGLAVVGSHGASCVAPRPWQPAQAATYRVNVRMKGCCEASVAYRRVAPSCSCRCSRAQMSAPNRMRQPCPRARLVRRTWVEK